MQASWHSHRVDMRVCASIGIAAFAAVCVVPCWIYHRRFGIYEKQSDQSWST